MAKTFEFTLQGDVEAKLEQIKRKAAAKGVTFRGDTKKGTFYMDIELPLVGKMRVLDGNYKVTGDKIRVAVRKKPSSYSWERVGSELRGFIEG